MNGSRLARYRNLSLRVGRRARAFRARARYRLGFPAPLVPDVALAPGFRHPIDSRQKERLAARYRDRFPVAVEAEIAEAHRLAAHRVTLLGHATEHADRVSWSRDPVSGREWSRGFSPDIPYRGPGRLGDIKLPWELNKHQFFFTLGKASWLLDDRATALEIVRQIDHWIDDNPYQSGIHWISALEAGTRAVSWIVSHPFYAGTGDGPFERRLAASLGQHFLFVEQHLSQGDFANTHLVGEAAALVIGGLFLECRHSARWTATGLGILEQEMERQVTSDAVHAERSIAYHRFFLDNYYLVAGFLAANGRSLPAATLAAVEKMTGFLNDVLFSDGTAPAFGDGDDARAIWFHADCPADYRGLLGLGAVLFDRGDLMTAAGTLPEEVFWLLGMEGVDRFDRLTPRLRETTSAAYPEGGYYIMRGGWAAADPVLAFDCGALGFGPGGHGHADALSVQLHAGGFAFLVDAGTYSYNIDYAWRDAFRATGAHNTVVVDREEQSIPRDRMSWSTMAQSRSRDWITTKWFDLADGEHDGYRRLPDPVTHRRIVVFVRPDTWLIWDGLAGSQPHVLESFLHVRPDCAVELDSGVADVLLKSPGGAELRLWTSGQGVDARSLDLLAGDDQQRRAWFSPSYGIKVPSHTIRISGGFSGHASLFTCLSTSRGARPMATLSESGGMELRIGRDGDCEERLIYRLDPSQARESTNGFDGSWLFTRLVADTPVSVSARGFRRLSLAGLDVQSPVSVDSLELESNVCHIAIEPGQASRLRFVAREGVRFAINGTWASASTGGGPE